MKIIPKIDLMSVNFDVDFKETLEDATKLGEEICRRFNEFPQDEKL